jgi:CubicO group peptidase (beta-lactamase class C family)
MNTQQLNETISKTLTAWNIPGGAVAVAQGDETFAQGYGVLEAGKPEAVNADTVFAIGSTTKAFTSALIGMLVDEGKLNWDDPVVKHLPDFQLYDDWVTKNVTVRDLLCHRLGLERAQKLYYHRGYDQREIMRRMRYLRPTVQFPHAVSICQSTIRRGRSARRSGNWQVMGRFHHRKNFQRAEHVPLVQRIRPNHRPQKFCVAACRCR